MPGSCTLAWGLAFRVWSWAATILTIGSWAAFTSRTACSLTRRKRVCRIRIASRVVHGIHIGTNTYWKRSLRNFISLNDFYYNKRIEREDYPWGSLTRANFSTCGEWEWSVSVGLGEDHLLLYHSDCIFHVWGKHVE